MTYAKGKESKAKGTCLACKPPKAMQAADTDQQKTTEQGRAITTRERLVASTTATIQDLIEGQHNDTSFDCLIHCGKRVHAS